MNKKDLINTLQMLVPLFVEEISKDPLKVEHAVTDAPIDGSPLKPPRGDGWRFAKIIAASTGLFALWSREVRPEADDTVPDYGHSFPLDGEGKCSSCGMGVEIVANTRARCPGKKPEPKNNGTLPDYAPTDAPEKNPEGPVAIEPIS